MPALPSSHVFWRRHSGGARTRYTIKSEMGRKVWCLTAQYILETLRKRGNCERKFSAMAWTEERFIGCEGARRRPIGLLRTKTNVQLPPPTRHITWRSKAHSVMLRLSLSSHEPSLTVAGRHRCVQELSSAATLRPNSELQLISVLKKCPINLFFNAKCYRLSLPPSMLYMYLKRRRESEGNDYLFRCALE